MTAIWISAAVATAVVIGFALGRRASAKARPQPPLFESEREEQLARRVAARAKAGVSDVLPSIRHEIALAPNQTDDTLVKRALYHYQMSLPERDCGGYRDTVRG